MELNDKIRLFAFILRAPMISTAKKSFNWACADSCSRKPACVEYVSLQACSMSADSDQPTQVCRVVLIGDFGVGKSTLFKRLTKVADPKREYGFVKLPDETKVMMIDTRDMEKFSFLTSNYYRDAACVLLCGDLTNVKSVQSLERWVEDVKAYSPNAKRILVLNKIDSPDADKDVLGAIESYATMHDCCFNVIVSAKSGQGIPMLLERIEEACRMYKSQRRRSTIASLGSPEPIRLELQAPPKKKRHQCCNT